MLRNHYRAAVAAAGFLVLSTAFVANAAIQGKSFSNELTFAFIVAAQPQAAASADKRAPASNTQEFSAGQLINTGDVLAALQAGTENAGDGANRHTYTNAQLVARLVNVASGEVVEDIVAFCQTLDFEQNTGAVFEEEVSCGDHRMAYSVSGDGIVITRDGETVYSYELPSGIYSLNGVPFVVN